MIGTRYYLPGGGHMRAYSDSLDIPVSYMWSNNVDLTFRTGQYGIKKLDLGLFMDMGQTSNDGTEWDWLGDIGINLSYKPEWKRTSWFTTLFRPAQIKVQLPLARYEGEEWVNTLSKELWVFSISN